MRMFSLKSAMLAAAVLLGCACTAKAADLPVRLPEPVFTWAGPYVGVHAGYMWGRSHVIDNGVLTENAARTNGGLIGVMAGYNWHRDAWVFGVEGDVALANVRGRGIAIPPILVPIVTPNNYSMDWVAHLRGRVGYSVTSTTLLFVAGGIGFTDLRFTPGGGNNQIIGTTRVGWTLGAGIDHAFTSNLIGRLEYLYDDFGTKSYTIAPNDVYTVGFKAQTVRGALIWKF